MFGFLKKKKVSNINKHECCFQDNLGFYYKLYRTEYRNGFDYVTVYTRVKCECGRYIDRIVSKEKFLPSLYSCVISEREEYVDKLEKNDILDECTFNIKTNLYSNRIS